MLATECKIHLDIICTNCLAGNPAGIKFCSECGVGLPACCEQCGTENPANAKFCGDCGWKLYAGPISERRQPTVLFCDLVGSTHLSTQFDPEDFRELLQMYQAACREAISELQGQIAQFRGDGVLAYFCDPGIHEDDARRAIEAALRITEKIGSLKALGRQLQVRIGIHTGLVVVGVRNFIVREAKTTLGGMPNLATRIQAEAQPNEILISEATEALVRGCFHLEQFGPRVLKGFVHKTALYRVLGRRELPGLLSS